MKLFYLTLILMALCCTGAIAEISISVIYLRQEINKPAVLSNLDQVPDNLGTAGAQLGLAENATTGKFLGHSYELEIVSVPIGGDLLEAAREALAKTAILILDMPAQEILKIADMPEAQNAILTNISAPDRVLRDNECRANLLHTLPSDSMRTDALMQFVRFKRWGNMAIIVGEHPQDRSFAAELRISAKKFGLSIGQEKTWAFDTDMRRTASQEVPLFTQALGDYDLLLIADEVHDFGRYVAFNTWYPRPVAGSEGLVPSTWSPVIEQWGAAQLQSRFIDHSGRAMRPKDYAAWAAIRSIAEAVTRTSSGNVKTLRTFLLSPDFKLAGFKGRPLSFRTWNGQLRQPISLVTNRAVVAQTPLPGYLHQRSEMDTLGLDLPESRCRAFK